MVGCKYEPHSLTFPAWVSRGNFLLDAPATPIMCGSAGSTGIVISARQSLIICTYCAHGAAGDNGKLHGADGAAVDVVVVVSTWTSLFECTSDVHSLDFLHLRYRKLSTFLEKIVCLPIFFNFWQIRDKITRVTFNIKSSTTLIQHTVMTTNYISPTTISKKYCLLENVHDFIDLRAARYFSILELDLTSGSPMYLYPALVMKLE